MRSRRHQEPDEAEASPTTQGTGPPRDHADAPLPPGPDGYPLLGSAPRFFRGPFDFYETLAGYGDVVRWRLPRFPFTTVFHPDGIQQVLVEDHDRFDRNVFGDFGVDFAPEGVFFTDGEQWRRQRRLLQPAFTMSRIESYGDAMAATTDRLAAAWDDGEVVAVDDAFGDLTLSILAKTLLDIHVDPTGEDATIARAAEAFNRRSDPTNLETFLPNWLPTPRNRRYNRAVETFRSSVDELVAQRRRERTPDGGVSTHDDLLAMLLDAADSPATSDRPDAPDHPAAVDQPAAASQPAAADSFDGRGLSDDEIRDNLLTFLFAGHETTALGLAFAVHQLALHDDPADRLRAELDAELGGDRPGVADLPALPTTEQVVRETLRLHPPAHLLIRRASTETVVDGYRLPEGTLVTLPQFHVHTDDRFYDDPEAFRPGRWTDSFEADLPEYAYFPFGGGPRHCIGMRFAMLELQLALAVLAQTVEFELLSDPDPSISSGATHRPADPVRVRMHRR